jgi:HD superfamily phosphodiesterase
MKKLTELIKEDSRIKRVYDYAKVEYNEANLTQHNFEHVIRVLYRVLIIADTEKNVNYKVLVPATLLHDIGATTGNYRQHEEAGIPIVKKILPELDYSKDEIESICHCIIAHKGRGVLPETLEAKILYDADVLEKSDLPSIYFAARVQYEIKVPLNKFIESTAESRGNEVSRGFFTRKATEIDNNGLKKRLEFDKNAKIVLEKRKDFTVTENDVW